MPEIYFGMPLSEHDLKLACIGISCFDQAQNATLQFVCISNNSLVTYMIINNGWK
jgi:hypothetical protein